MISLFRASTVLHLLIALVGFSFWYADARRDIPITCYAEIQAVPPWVGMTEEEASPHLAAPRVWLTPDPPMER